MKPIRKFQFDADFDAEAERLREEQEGRVREQEEAALAAIEAEAIPPAPSFDEEQLRQAQRESFEKGLQQGREDMRISIENTANLVLDHLAIKLEGLMAEQIAQVTSAQELAVRTSVATLKKCWPQIVTHLGLDNVEKTIRQAMEYNPEETRIVVRVHDSMLDVIVKRLDALQTQQAFSGKVIVLSDDAVVAGDCKVEWADGGMERIGRVMTAQLDKAMERILAGLSQPAFVAQETSEPQNNAIEDIAVEDSQQNIPQDNETERTSS